MIQANELRIGNWVNREYFNPHPTDPSIELDSCFIYSIQSDRVSVRISDKKVIARIPTEKIHPIPLTPEILEKCGFSERSLVFTGNVGFTIKEENFYIGLLSDEKGGWKFHNPHFNLTIKYLHQLQNLYFALTGEELIYKP